MVDRDEARKKARKLRTMAALDAFPGLVQRKPAVASIWKTGEDVESALRRVARTDTGITLTTVPGT